MCILSEWNSFFQPIKNHLNKLSLFWSVPISIKSNRNSEYKMFHCNLSKKTRLLVQVAGNLCNLQLIASAYTTSSFTISVL